MPGKVTRDRCQVWQSVQRSSERFDEIWVRAAMTVALLLAPRLRRLGPEWLAHGQNDEIDPKADIEAAWSARSSALLHLRAAIGPAILKGVDGDWGVVQSERTCNGKEHDLVSGTTRMAEAAARFTPNLSRQRCRCHPP